jgi:TonB family protein
MMADEGPRQKNNTVVVSLMKPPPMPEMKVKPIEQPKELPKQEEIVTEQINEPESAGDNTPAGDALGVDADGKAGSDAFGLVGRKGGRSLLDGGDGLGKFSLQSKYAGYTQVVQTTIRKKVMKRLDDEGGIPKGKFEVAVRLHLDSAGAVIDYRIVGSSGNHRIDEAVKQVLDNFKVKDPPPDGMPQKMIFKIMAQG